MATPSVSIVVPTFNEGRNVVDTIDCVLRNSPAGVVDLTVVDDGSSDESLGRLRTWAGEGRLTLLEADRLGPARCRNLGARSTRGDLIVFLDAHCFTPKGWLAPLVEVMHGSPEIGVAGPVIAHTGDFRLRGYGGTWHDENLDMHWLPPVSRVTQVPFQPAGCQIVRREVFERLGGYDDGLKCWGKEDVEFCVRAWLFGYRVCVQPASTVYHLFRKQFPYEIDHVQFLYNKLRLIFSHFDRPRLDRVLAGPLRDPGLAQALARIYTDGTRERRESLQAERKHSMDWFCDRFGLLA